MAGKAIYSLKFAEMCGFVPAAYQTPWAEKIDALCTSISSFLALLCFHLILLISTTSAHTQQFFKNNRHFFPLSLAGELL
jgi:hypothetical protein